jgi:hypothetical protein
MALDFWKDVETLGIEGALENVNLQSQMNPHYAGSMLLGVGLYLHGHG